METKEITNKEEWEGFLAQCAEKTFLQSWNWGEFCAEGATASGGNQKIWRLGVYESGRLMAVAFVYKISARRGTFLFIPHGPMMQGNLAVKDKKEILEGILAYLTENVAGKEHASFIRVAPIVMKNQENKNLFEEMGFRKAPTHMHPETTWELDITPAEEEILMGMRKTTRYLIRRAGKNPDIKIEKSTDQEDLKLFWPVYCATAKRHHFVVFPEKYLQAEFDSFAPDKEIQIFLGKYKGQVVSAAIFVFWQNICFYHHSGSLTKFNKFPVSYLLQWEAIKEAKRRGCNAYNFWGIAPRIETGPKGYPDASMSHHPWAGLSLFKMGFGGYKKDYVETQDFILSSKYWLTFVIEKIRKRKRNL